MKMKLIIYSLGIALGTINATLAQSPPPSVAVNTGPVTLFSNVRIFDGKSDKLSAPSYVLVRGNVIEKISDKPIPTDRRADTTLVDGGPTFGLKQAIDEGIIPGPRIFPSGAIITITGGHGDFRELSELPRTI